MGDANSVSAATRGSKGTSAFFVTLLVLTILRVALGFVALPTSALPLANTLLAAIYLGVPILALYFAAGAGWSVRTSLFYLIAGIALHAAGYLLTTFVLGERGLAAGIVNAIAFNIGQPMWCVGLGTLVATRITDKNMLVPMGIFLAWFDAFMVFAPVGVAAQVIQIAPKVLAAVASPVPTVSDKPTTGFAQAGAYIGPADFVFIAMFFAALFTFRLNPARTLRWMVPVLVIYLFVVLVFGFALPALIPISAVVLLVNWREFRMKRDEWVGTAVAAALGIGLFAWGISQPPPKPRVVPSPTADDPASGGSPQTPAPDAAGSRPSGSPSAPGNTPGPR